MLLFPTDTSNVAKINQIIKEFKIQLAQFRELEAFSKFGSDLDEETIRILDNGKKIINKSFLNYSYKI